MFAVSSATGVGHPPVPRWVRIVDAVAVAGLLFAVCVAVGSGSRFDLIGNRIAITRPVTPLIVAALLLFFRHWWFRRPSLPERIAAVFHDDAIATGVRTALISRLLVYAIGFYAVFAIGYPVKPLPFLVAETELGNLQARWDTGWYLVIARDGYRFDPNYHRQQNVAFFPAYPWLMRLGGPLFGRSDRDLLVAARCCHSLRSRSR